VQSGDELQVNAREPAMTAIAVDTLTTTEQSTL
jgi:hypothetical protein